MTPFRNPNLMNRVVVGASLLAASESSSRASSLLLLQHIASMER